MERSITGRLITSEPVTREPTSRHIEGRVSQFFCGITGHTTIRRFEGDRMYLECLDCGHESPGWSTK